jgi:hypothetical protein
MGCGITPEQFWYGDYTYFHYYERAEQARQKRENYFAWLNGVYTFKALAATVGNIGAKNKSDMNEYPDRPLAMTAEEIEEEKRRKYAEKEQKFIAGMQARISQLKAQQERKQNG